MHDSVLFWCAISRAGGEAGSATARPHRMVWPRRRGSSGELFVANAVRLRSGFAQTLLAIGFVLGVVALEEGYLRVVLVRQDMGGDTVQEPAIVRDHDGRAGEVQQRFFQRAQGFHVEVVGRFVEQQYVGALLEGQSQVQTAALTTGQVLDELLLVGALEVEAAHVTTSPGRVFGSDKPPGRRGAWPSLWCKSRP